MSSDLLPEGVRALLHAHGYHIGAVAPTSGGFSNTTLAVWLDGTRRVLKLATSPAKREDLRHEAQMLAVLGAYSLPLAPLHAIHEDADWTVLVCAWRDGIAGLHLLASPPDVATLVPVFRALGAALARLHRCPPAAVSAALHARLHIALAALPRDALFAAFSAAAECAVWALPPRCIVHGDAGLHNVLWNAGDLTLLDWEWSVAGVPQFDLAWLLWTIRWRHLPPATWEAVQAGYGASVAFAPGEWRALVLGQIACILARSQHNPAAIAEWQRRAAWTLALPAEPTR